MVQEELLLKRITYRAVFISPQIMVYLEGGEEKVERMRSYELEVHSLRAPLPGVR